MTDHQSIEQYLNTKYGHDQYEAWKHADCNRPEIVKSDKCVCFFCFAAFASDAITNWIDDGQTACCPNCGLGNVVLGSASGLPFEREFLELVHAHWF